MHPSPDERVIAEFAAFVKTVSYKPGWTLRVFKLDFGIHAEPWVGAQLMVCASTQDSDDPSKLTTLTLSVEYTAFVLDYTRERWEEHVYRLITQAEKHETDEFFRVDGKKVRDPHVVNPPLPTPHRIPTSTGGQQ